VRNRDQHAGVQYILDSVVAQLAAVPSRRFIYAEVAFLARWWQQQDEAMRRLVRELVQEGMAALGQTGGHKRGGGGRWEGLGGTERDIPFPFVPIHVPPGVPSPSFLSPWVSPFLFLVLSQPCPQLCPQSLLAVVAGEVTVLSPGILPNVYNPPPGLCWDQLCTDPPVVDGDGPERNVDTVVSSFLDAAATQAQQYRTNHIIMTMGSDFHYENAHLWFKNLDKLIAHVNARQANGSRIHALYSTPSCYLRELHRANLTWPLKTDDFFPYSDGPNQYWTGYFSSRPAFKGYERLSSSFLQICSQLEALAGPSAREGPYGTGDSSVLRKAVAVAQHHDAVSGTERQHVANDYARQLAKGWDCCQVLVANALSLLGGTKCPFVFCNALNISMCPLSETADHFTVILYNPLARRVAWPVRLPVRGSSYAVTDPEGQPVASQVSLDPTNPPNPPHPPLALGAPGELLFQAWAPPLGFSAFGVKQLSPADPWEPPERPSGDPELQIENEHLRVLFDPRTGLLREIQNLAKGFSLPVSQGFYWYNASAGNTQNPQASGAYIFRPNSSTPIPVAKCATTRLLKTPLVQELHQNFSAWCSQVLRLRPGQPYLELEWTVGPIPGTAGHTWAHLGTLGAGQGTAGHSWAHLGIAPRSSSSHLFCPPWQDEKLQLTVLTDRSQGGGSILDGSLELMVHRRLLKDDNRGVTEPLNEPGSDGRGLVVRGRHLVLLDTAAASADQHRPLAQEMTMSPSVVLAPGAGPHLRQVSGEGLWVSPAPGEVRVPGVPRLTQPSPQFSGLCQALPPNIHLLSLEPRGAGSLLLRLEHLYERGESQNGSQPATVDLTTLFSAFTITSVREMALGGDIPLRSVSRLLWTTATG
ncbi:MA2B1 mannosidase, partial [Grantiella picta]|nr:MA2B1 mannosidase [Grantiella picta]